MAEYSYIAKDNNNETTKGHIVAKDKKEFYEGLSRKGLYCTSYTIKNEKVKIYEKPVQLKDLVIMCRQFGTMLDSGVSVVKAIDILYEQADKPYLKTLFFEIYEDVQKGNTISSAMKKHEGAFPNLFISMIESGEASGTLDLAMMKLGTHYEKENILRNKTRTAMIYPTILACVASVVILILMLFVVPNFFELFTDDLAQLPWNTRLLIQMSQALITHWIPILIGVLISIVGGIILLKNSKVRENFDSFKLDIPIIGKLYQTILSARFAQTMATLYLSGISLIEALTITQKVLGNKAMDNGFEAAKENIIRGMSLSEAIQEMDFFPPMLSQMIYIGEESGSLDQVLEKTSKFYEEEAETAIQKMVSLLEPTMIVILGIIVGFIIASVLPPIYDMFQNIG
ncbi:MAG: type II secretion system F family protein [Cellulosilyticaceae bacterium]